MSDEMIPITVRLPDDLIEALNRATQYDGRPSASDMVRYILREYLRDRRAELAIKARSDNDSQ